MKDKLKPIIHIATDEKFIDTAYYIYEKAFPGKNYFIILLKKEDEVIKHVSTEKDYTFIKIDGNYDIKIKEIVKGRCLLVFHGLDPNQSILAMKLKDINIKYMWTVFGFEIYKNYEIFQDKIYGKMTHNKFIFGYLRSIKNMLRPYLRWYLKQKVNSTINRKESLKLMDYVGILYNEEMDLYKELKILKDNAKLIKFTYYPLDLIVNSESEFVQNSNILLGNSASYSNNHLEAFEVLEKLNTNYIDIITPLSYGKDEYAEQVIKIGEQKFAEKFKPLTEFLPLIEYQKILLNCGIVIMNHYRQQAVGNVINGLYLGAKVYLSNKNTLYHYLKRIGCYVFCIEEDLVPENESAFNLLNKNQMMENRKILKKELSLDIVVSELKKKIDPIIN